MKNKYFKIYGRNAIWDDFQHEDRIRGIERRLRYCKATVGITVGGEYTYLRSYDTIVCVIDNYTCEAVDVLRTEFGYTRTSAQHIAKFLKDYYHKALFRTDVDRNGQYYRRIY